MINLETILPLVSAFFPKLDIKGKYEQAKQQVGGVADNFQSVNAALQGFGITGSQINKIADTVLNNPMSKQICRSLGVNPQLLAMDVRRFAEGNHNTKENAPKMELPKVRQQFPRLK